MNITLTSIFFPFAQEVEKTEIFKIKIELKHMEFTQLQNYYFLYS